MKIIFLHPMEVGKHVSGSAVRPQMMLKTFRRKGYDVFEITGDKADRKIKYDSLLRAFNDGQKFDYLYVESLSRPTNSRISKFLGFKVLVTEKLEYKIIKACIAQGIPAGFYLRDLHWDFSEHYKGMPLIKRIYLQTVLSYFGRQELKFLSQNSIKVFTPSRAFSKFLESKWNLKSSALPPGAEVKNRKIRTFDRIPLRLFYVGGVSGIYNPKVFLEGLLSASSIHCTICTRPAERKVLQAFELNANVNIVEGSGEALTPYFDESHIALYPLAPIGYIKLAHSVKISEYIANGLPTIAFEGTIIAEMIAHKNIGWVIPFKSDAVAALIEELITHPHAYNEKQKNVIQMQSEIGWDHVVDRLERKLSIG